MSKSNTKDRIIASATKLFDKYGFENVTVNQIIEDTNTSKGTFYHYFKAKDELLVYILDDHNAEIKKYVHDLPKDLNACCKIKLLIQYIFEIYQNNNNEISISNAKQIYHTQLTSSDKFLLKENRYIFIIFSELAGNALANNEICIEYSANEIASTILMLLRGMFFNWYLCETQFNIVEKGCYIINLYIDHISNKN